MMANLVCQIESLADTDRLAAKLARVLPEKLTIGLTGTLGAGKTRFVQGLAAAFNISSDTVVSPTFVLCQQYRGDRTIFHLDAYRLRDDDEFLELGPEEMFDASAITVIEWAERIVDCLPADRLVIRIDPGADETRQFTFEARGPRSASVVEALRRTANR
jgi:tRNA threonylcarbamoyladenosine biosynthesis protein TsaE